MGPQMPPARPCRRFWSVVTNKDSMREVALWKKALMFAAGKTSTAICFTAICSIAAAYAAMATSVPGRRICSGPP